MLRPMHHLPPSPAGSFDWHSRILLIFSQDDAFRFLVRSTFRKLALRDVLSTSIAADAATLLDRQPALVLVDLDGDPRQALMLVQRLRNQSSPCPLVPVMVVAMAGDTQFRPQALALGIEAMVAKPISPHELAHRVAVTIARPSRMRTEIAVARPPSPIARPVAPAAVPPKPPTPSPSVRGFTAGAGRSGGGSGTTPMMARLRAEDVPAKPPAQRLGAEDLVAPVAPAAPSHWDEDDLAAPRRPTPRRDDVDSVPPFAKTSAKMEWQDGVAAAGHAIRAGKDVPALDVAALVAEHGKWLHSQGAEGKRANFAGKDLAGAELAGMILAGAGFRHADLSDAALAECRLDGADFRHASLSAADCSRAVLGVAQLRHANLRLANLEGANLRGADLSGAQLGGARLAGADFTGAILVESDLRETDLSRVDNLTQSQLDRATADSTTRVPAGLWVRVRAEG